MRPFLDVARNLALEAATRIQELLKAPLVRERKPDYSLVTNADHEADRIIREGLRKAFPSHTILTEESGMEGSPDTEYMWVVDPVDGTRAYAKGVPGYSVMVGLLKEGMPYLGVVVDPVEGHIYEAMKGEGAWLSGVRAHVSRRSDYSSMPVTTSTGFPQALQKPIAHKLTGPWLLPVNSVGIKVGLLVRQAADIYINHQQVHYWDTCAPQIILEEAGGRLTDWEGKSLDYSFSGEDYRHKVPTLATNGKRHMEICQILRSL